MNMSEHNAKVRRYHEKIKSEGLKCKYCGHESKDYRLVDSKYGLSTLTCRKCEQDVIISEEPQKPRKPGKPASAEKAEANKWLRFHLEGIFITLSMSLIIGGIGFGTLDSLTSGEKSTFDYYLPIGATVLSSFFLLFALKTITFEREVVRIAKLICTLLAVPLVELNIYLWVKIGGAMGGIGATLSKVGIVLMVLAVVLIGYRLLDVMAEFTANIAFILKRFFGGKK